MPRARKRAATPEEAELEEHHDEVMEDAEAGNALQFDEPLTWKAGKPIAVTELLRRLKTLYEELQSTEQGEADRETVVPKAQELAKGPLLDHKDKGVKAWTLLCIVEMFRLLAPDAPYKGGQLKKIFELFVSTVIPALASPSDPYNQQYLLMLTSLTTVKSIILLTDIPGSDGLILNLFTNCFDVMSGNVKGSHGEQLGKNVEFHMTSMLCTLVEECQELPTGVVDIILAQFLRADPHTLSMGGKKAGAQPDSFVLREVSPAYNMARSVCNTCADKMSRVVGHYFTAVLIDASETFSEAKAAKPRGKKRTHDESEDESDDGMLTPPAEEDWREVEKAHRLLRELWRSSPEVIANIIPQMEAEAGAENAQLRIMAVQTVGDMVAGIGAAGPPPPPEMDPAAYPSQSLDTSSSIRQYDNVLLAPAAPHAFSSVYPAAYQAFFDRCRDKSAQVRSVWATAAGHIIETAGGGKGMDASEESQLLHRIADMLLDTDERVRLAAINAVARFDFNTVLQKLDNKLIAESKRTVLSDLCDRIKDRKQAVRAAAVELLARIWGVAAGAIAEGSERTREVLGSLPSKILNAIYINDRELNALVYHVLYESLLPVHYPPLKAKQALNGDSQRVADSQVEVDLDALRAERVLVLVRDLDEKAKKVFFAVQKQQAAKAQYMDKYLTACSKVYGSSNEDEEDVDEKAAKKELETMIGVLTGTLPDASVAVDHLRKFAKHHDRRCYQLIRFCYSPESDYRKVVKAMKELTKRLEDAPTGIPPVADTLLAIVRLVSVLVNNRSHVPAILAFSRTDDKALGTAAHEVIQEISTNAPEVFKVHVHELCSTLQRQAPSATTPNPPTAVNDLKACAGFATKFPKEMPQDRDFYRAMTAFAKHGVPPEAAKHAVTVIVAAADKRDMYVKEILSYALTNYAFGAESFLSRLAALSQLRLVANKQTEEHADEIMAVAVTKTFGEQRTMDDPAQPAWMEHIDDDLCAKLWGLKILVNGLRGMKTSDDPQEAVQEISAVAPNVYRLLNTLIAKDGELSSNATTARHHQARLRLAAAQQILKLSCSRLIDSQLTPGDFNTLARVAQDPLPEVRGGFVKTLKKYLGQSKIPNRFYGMVFLYAFEPTTEIMEQTMTWLRSRAALAAKSQDTAMESVFPRFLSLLAHHQDFGAEPDELQDFVEYIMFYLKTVATEANLPLIYHLAQRVKTVQDGIDLTKSDNLYVMSDLAEAVIRTFQDVHSWSLQLYPGKARLPAGIFAPMASHTVAQEIAEKNYLPPDLAENLEDLVKASMRTKKRKSDGSSKQAAKKAKTEKQAKGGADDEAKPKKKLAVRKAVKTPSKAVKTPKKKAASAIPSSQLRKSVRTSNARSYAEPDDSEDDEEMQQWERDGDEEDSERVESSTPPTSDPTPAPIPAPVEVEEPEKAVNGKKEAKKAPSKPEPKAPKRNASAKSIEKDEMDVPGSDDEESGGPGKASAQPSANQALQRNARATKNAKANAKDEMEVPSSDEEASRPSKKAAVKKPPTRNVKAAKAQEEKSIMDFPSDSEGEKEVPARKKAKPAAKKAPQRNTRAARSKKEKDVMEVPSDSEELSEAPSDMEA